MTRSSRRRTARTRSEAHDSVYRQRLLLAFWVLCAGVLLARAIELQVVEVADWREAANRQQLTQSAVPAERGSILDRDGIPLALSQETFQVGVAPHELRDREASATLLQEVLHLSSAEAGRITASERRWITLPGRYPPTVRESLAGRPGVYLERELRRFYPQGALGRGLLGTVIDEAGTGGIEQEFEGHLRGEPGAEVLARDSRGRPIPGETWAVRSPLRGGSVVLTLDASLQEIASEALRTAVESTGSRGGDLLVTEPTTGEVLAMVSIRNGGSAHVGAINTPYEPGSTLKPFTVAALLRRRKATLDDSVDTGNGSWTTRGRTIHDISAVGVVSLRHALQVSSNVGIAKAAQVLLPGEQYEALRDFGFGSPTGVPLPGEVAGTLRRPPQWSAQSPASLAIGYEIAVTPIQMAMAYGAVANGGVLMQPLLVRELRDADGKSIQEFRPRSLRRVISRRISRELTQALVGVVEEGTGTRARVASFAVAGKSGTSRVYAPNGGYEIGEYFSSFVGFFPAEDPKLVIFVKLEAPQGQYYGGATAAPVTRATMEAILAARKSPLDAGAMATLARSQRIRVPESIAQAARSTSEPMGRAVFASSVQPARVSLAQGPIESARRDTPELDRFAMPELTGLSSRVAARRLHALGLSVIWQSAGIVGGTAPDAGSLVARGDTVRLLPDESSMDPSWLALRGLDR
jgi:cell division protein FtsI (penicillin-binding protein 3)